MDRKTILVLVVTFVILMAWFPLVNKLYPPKQLPPSTNQLSRAFSGTNQVIVTNQSPSPTYLQSAPALPPTFQIEAKETTETLEVGGIKYLFTSHGGGLKSVELRDYPEIILPKRHQTNGIRGVVLNRDAPLPVMAVVGHSALVEDGLFKLSRRGQTIIAQKVLTNGVVLIKEFSPSTNLLLQVKIRMENRSGHPVMLPSQQYIAGTATLINATDDPLQMGVFINSSGNTDHIDDSWFANRFMGCFPGTPRERYEAAAPVSWAAVHNRFFTIVTVPKLAAPQFIATHADIPTSIVAGAKVPGLQAALIYPSVTLEAAGTNSVLEREFTLYTGPKEYNTLSSLASDMKNDVDHVMKFNGFFGWFSKGLLLAMNWLHDSLKLAYGLAIIAITLIIKIAFWPLTQASTRSMKRMSTMQPQMKVIQDKYKDDPQKMNKKMMEFMKENKVNPMGGCLPMLIQIPVFFGFYYMIQSAIELRGASFLWAWDLSQADTVAFVFGFPINPMPLIMGVTMFWQAQLTPPSPGMDPTQQKMMKYMPLIFLFILYKMSAGLTLYWTIQNLLTIAQTKLTKTEPPVTATPQPVLVKRK
ncbi:MAG: membrane protein insertase YidC [Verrucomicrobiota bacterium]